MDGSYMISRNVDTNQWSKIVIPWPLILNGEMSYTWFNRHLYAVGGGDSSTEVQKYDPLNKQWTLCPAITKASRKALTVVVGSKLYVIGSGRGDNYIPMEVFDGVGWLTLTPVPYFDYEFITACVYGTRIYVFGMKRVCQYDCRTHEWTSDINDIMKRGKISSCVIKNRIYIKGHHYLQCFNPETSTFDKSTSDDKNYKCVSLNGLLYHENLDIYNFNNLTWEPDNGSPSGSNHTILTSWYSSERIQRLETMIVQKTKDLQHERKREIWRIVFNSTSENDHV
jgi:hypothetical protein